MPIQKIENHYAEAAQMYRPQDLVFLVGMPRSGTKLLRDLLNRHPDIAIFPNESHFIPSFYRRYGTRSDLGDERVFGALFHDFRKTAFYRRLKMRGIVFTEQEWKSHLRSGRYPDVLRAMFACYQVQSGAQFVGDKTPEYLTQVPLITELLPEARFVHIVRDPRDYALSIRNAWGKSIPRAVYRWKLHIRKYVKDVAAGSVPQITVRYEELVTAPELVLSQICEFLGVHFQPQMTSLDVVSEELGDAKGLSTILSSNTQKWVGRLSTEDLRMIDSIAGAEMANFGYQPATVPGDDNLTWITNLRYRATDAVNLFRRRRRTEGGLVPALRESWRAYRDAGTDE